MSDKDPVREQIERDAEKYSSRFDYDHRPYACEDYDIGASKQDQIAWNRCLDAQKAKHLEKIKLAKERISSGVFELEKIIALEAAITYAECTIKWIETERR